MNFTHLAAKLGEPSTICLLVLAATTGFLLFRTQQRLARLGATIEPDAASTATEWNSRSAEYERCELELHEKARALCAQIDTKLALLQTLIAQSHEAAARLEAALAREEDLHSPLSETCDALDRQSVGLALDELDAADFPMDSNRAEPPVTSLNNHAGITTADRREEIYTLADYGFETGEIACRIGRPRGEIELVLSLRAA